MKYTIQFLKEGNITIVGVGALKKGLKILCTKAVAEEFRNDTRFEVTGLVSEAVKTAISKPKKREE